MTSPSYPSGTGSVTAIGGHPLHPMLVPLPVAALVMALGADIAFMVTAGPFWGEAAKWLLLIVLISGALAAIVGLIDLLGIDRARTMAIGFGQRIGNVLLLFVTGANYLLRAGGDADVASSYGIILTAAAVGLIMLGGWLETGSVGIKETDDPEFLPGDRPDLGRH